MNAQQAYIEGFVKRANEYGFNEQEALNILKQANGAPLAAIGSSKPRMATYGGVKNLGEMINEWRTGKPTEALQMPVSKGPPQINPALAVK